MTGRYDASYGCFLRGNRNKTFTSIPAALSGLILDGDVKDMSLVNLSNGEKILAVAVNNDAMRVFSVGARQEKIR